MGRAIETLRHLALHRPVSKCVHDVVHGGELTLTPPLGALPEFVPVMLDLRLVPQRHLCADLLRERGARMGRGVHCWRAGSRLHGDQLHLVGLATRAIGRATGQAVNVVEDG